MAGGHGSHLYASAAVVASGWWGGMFLICATTFSTSPCTDSSQHLSCADWTDGVYSSPQSCLRGTRTKMLHEVTWHAP